MEKIVLLGGGTGLSNLISALKKLDLDISVGVAVSDNGGSTGKIRKYYDIPAPGDLRKVINSFIDQEDLKELFEYRFDHQLEDHTIGNLVLTALVDLKGDMTQAVKAYRQIFNIKPEIYPISNSSIQLSATMKNSKVIVGEEQITSNKHKIKKVFYKEHIEPNKDILQKIIDADFIILSPGSLYTSILPNLIITQMIEAIKKSKAKVIYISNIMTQKGETTDYSVSDHIKAIEKHTYSNIIDIIIANNYYNISKEVLHNYKKEGSHLVKLDTENLKNYEIYQDKFIKEDKYIRHDVNKISKALINLIKRSK